MVIHVGLIRPTNSRHVRCTSDSSNFCLQQFDEKGHNRAHAPQQTKALFYNLVGGHLHDEWHREAERLGGLEIDDQLKFRWLHDWEVSWLGSL